MQTSELVLQRVEIAASLERVLPFLLFCRLCGFALKVATIVGPDPFITARPNCVRIVKGVVFPAIVSGGFSQLICGCHHIPAWSLAFGEAVLITLDAGVRFVRIGGRTVAESI